MPPPSILREPSTQRGIVWVVSGLVVLVQTFLGDAASVDTASVMSRVEFWTGLAMTIAGALGFLPDRPHANQNQDTSYSPAVADSERVQQSALPTDRSASPDGWNG